MKSSLRTRRAQAPEIATRAPSRARRPIDPGASGPVHASQEPAAGGFRLEQIPIEPAAAALAIEAQPEQPTQTLTAAPRAAIAAARSVAASETSGARPEAPARGSALPLGAATARAADIPPRTAAASAPTPVGPATQVGGAAPADRAPQDEPLVRAPAATTEESLRAAASADPAQPLPERIPQEMRLGGSLAHVRVHTGPSSRAALSALDADGATLGSDVFVSELPAHGTEENQRAAREVLAHEVAHAAGPAPAQTPVASEAAAHTAGTALADAAATFHRPGAQTAASNPARSGVARAAPAEGALALRRAATEQPASAPASLAEGDPATALRARAPGPGSESAPELAPSAANAPARAVPAASVPGEPGAAGTQELEASSVRALPAAPGTAATAPEAAPLEGEGVDGVTEAFAAAPPSQKAYAYDTLSDRLAGEAAAEATGMNAELPAFEQRMGGEAEMGAVDGGLLLPETSAAEEVAPEGGAAPVADEVVAAAPENEEFAGNDSLFSWFDGLFAGSPAANAEHIGDAIENIETVDAAVATSPGPAPAVPLEGATDPGLIAQQQTEGIAQAQAGQTGARDAVVQGPGPETVQPLSMDESVALEPVEQGTPDAQPEVEGIAQFKAANLPPDVQASFDEQNSATMQASLQGAEQQVGAAVETRDTSWAQEVEEAQAQNQTLVDSAQQDQNAAVDTQRARIQEERQDTLDAQALEVERVQGDADDLRDDKQSAIDDRVTQDEAEIDRRYSEAEESAQREVEAGQSRAEDEKRQAEREAEDESWWDRATSFISDVISAVVDAVNAIIDEVREAVNTLLDAVRDAVVGLIELAAQFIQEAIAAYGALLTSLVNELLGDVFPELAAALTSAIEGAVDLAQQAVRAVADTLIEGVNALVDAVQAGLNTVLDAFQAAVSFAGALIQAALAGDWAAVLRMMLEAALQLAGIEPAAFYAFVGQVEETFGIIVNDPLGFLGNLFGAVSLGFGLFVDNIVEHLRTGFFEWVVGPLGELGITLPETWDIWSILGIVLQVLGLTQEGIRGVIVEELGETAGAVFDYVWRYVEALLTGGFQALWEQIQNDLSSLWDMVVEGIKGWLIETIITQGITKLLSLIDPTGIAQIVQVVMTAWGIYEFLRDNLQRIWGVVTAIVDTISEIAHGVLQSAGEMVENALASLVPIAISLVANLAGLGGITERVREIIENIRETVRNAIRSLIRRVRGLFGGGGAEAEEDEDEDTANSEGVGETIEFTADGDNHRLWFEQSGASVEVMAASEIEPVRRKFERWSGNAAGDAEALGEITTARQQLANLEQAGRDEATADDRAETSTDEAAARTAAEKHDATVQAQQAFSTTLRSLLIRFEDDAPLPATEIPVRRTDAGRANEVVAKPLTKEGLNGTPPGSATPVGWAHANALPETWVRMHMLNEHLGGRGENWNLIPGRGTTNSHHHSGAEEGAKEAVEAGKTLQYRTWITGYHDAGDDADITRGFPRRISTEWYEVERDDVDHRVGGGAQGSWSEETPAPPLDGAEPLNVNHSSRFRLATEGGLGVALARRVAQERPLTKSNLKDEVAKPYSGGVLPEEAARRLDALLLIARF